ncbi:MAG: peptide chain release factor-like protein [Planctomycetota bacterium]|nr:peptide chain release factor-like protein [Planctomycetota bacterium]
MTDATKHPATIEPKNLLVSCDEHFVRRSGPGGQHRNKVETGVRLIHKPTGIKAEAYERRSQPQNRSMALFRLRVILALKIRTNTVDNSPTPLWRTRTSGGRISVNPRHNDFPAMLAEALDAMEFFGWEPRSAANHLKVTPSQLIKLIAKEPAALGIVNRERALRDMHPLKS